MKKHPEFLSHKIFVNRRKTKWCIVKVYSFKYDMQVAYKKFRPHDTHHFHVAGVHCGYELLRISKSKKEVMTGETGTIFLNVDQCGAGIATHEIMHAILWAKNHKRNADQYPIVIKNMKEEESMLMDFTYAVQQFYRWYWKVYKRLKFDYENI